ncbi:hypothetical protein [Microcoleus sp. PH2017_05_CCC_O_A]|uniref:hypothetical protein n=1 Tax=Microcoleus sp. PH2017_05_CCC_O_A TaxID=2798816 RepID=UPI001DAFA9AA|nr:hypothetical protein [Microcoleus sp. PH2017_05_CCC_O_A]MCC3436685.1 hypothetical protein [Microcoleus sp. PH2017_05_CCC_O_A]
MPPENLLIVEQASCLFFARARSPCHQNARARSPCHQKIYGLEAHATRKFTDCGTGILPVFCTGWKPMLQENLLIVEQASCLFLPL